MTPLSLDTALTLHFGHTPGCGDEAEFPWDCTCDYGQDYERIAAALAHECPAPALRAALSPLRVAEGFISDIIRWQNQPSVDLSDQARRVEASVREAIVILGGKPTATTVPHPPEFFADKPTEAER